MSSVLLALSLLGQGTPIAVGASGSPNLGKPTNDVSLNQYFPLGNFRRVGAPLKQGARLELLFIDTQVDASSAAESWPVVKALQQFGTISNVSTLPAKCQNSGPGTPVTCDVPGLNIGQARYKSSYVQFAQRDLVDLHGNCHTNLPKSELELLQHLHRKFGTPDPRQSCKEMLLHINGGLPVLLVGGYLQVGLQVVLNGDFATPAPMPTTVIGGAMTGLPAGTVQQALASGTSPKGNTLVEDVNAEANIISALICHADGKKPRSVCSRPAIRQDMKHVK